MNQKGISVKDIHYYNDEWVNALRCGNLCFLVYYRNILESMIQM